MRRWMSLALLIGFVDAATLSIAGAQELRQSADEDCPSELRLFYYTNYGEPHLCVRDPHRPEGIDLRGLCAEKAEDGTCSLRWEGHVYSYKGGPADGWFVAKKTDVCPSKGSTFRFKHRGSNAWLSRSGGTTFRYVLFGECIDSD